jgi:hypothetical protein
VTLSSTRILQLAGAKPQCLPPKGMADIHLLLADSVEKVESNATAKILLRSALGELWQ